MADVAPDFNEEHVKMWIGMNKRGRDYWSPWGSKRQKAIGKDNKFRTSCSGKQFKNVRWHK
jgi:hypothetical protein